MARTPLALAAAGMFLFAATPVHAQPQDGAQVQRSAFHDYQITTVAEGLVHPWSVAFLPGGDLLITERPGRLRIVRDGTLLPNAVEGVPDVLFEGQGGLMDVLPHPDFASNNLLYLSFSKPVGDGSSATTAVVRGTFENDRFEVMDEVFEAVSEGRPGHYGSRLAFDPDGYLYITVGDRQIPPQGDLASHPAQDVSNHHGTLNRLMEDGTVPDDNPFVGQSGARPEIWSYGHRNAQGLAIHPETGEAWTTEHGPQGGDEVNIPQAGSNYGWPVIGYGVNYRSGAAIHTATHQEGMEQPAHIWVPSIGASGLLFYTGDQFPGWRGNLFAGGLSGQQLARLSVDGHDIVTEETLINGLGRVRDVRQGPDGYIYIALDARGGDPSSVIRLEPAN